MPAQEAHVDIVHWIFRVLWRTQAFPAAALPALNMSKHSMMRSTQKQHNNTSGQALHSQRPHVSLLAAPPISFETTAMAWLGILAGAELSSELKDAV